MATYRALCQFPVSSTLPKDMVTISPHFNGSDPAALAAALKTNFIANNAIADKPFTIKVYDALKAPPSFPLATAEQLGTPPAAATPREVALCLSYFTTYNRPRFRGRLYLPAWWFTSAPGERPTQATTDSVIAFAKAVFGTGMPAQTNWVVYSPTEGKSQGGVSSIWCDNEWDTVRSRGLKATLRSSAGFP